MRSTLLLCFFVRQLCLWAKHLIPMTGHLRCALKAVYGFINQFDCPILAKVCPYGHFPLTHQGPFKLEEQNHGLDGALNVPCLR